MTETKKGRAPPPPSMSHLNFLFQ